MKFGCEKREIGGLYRVRIGWPIQIFGVNPKDSRCHSCARPLPPCHRVLVLSFVYGFRVTRGTVLLGMSC